MCSTPAMAGRRFPADLCALPKLKARSCRCSAADIARMRGFCGTVQWTLSVCCTRVTSRLRCVPIVPDVLITPREYVMFNSEQVLGSNHSKAPVSTSVNAQGLGWTQHQVG